MKKNISLDNNFHKEVELKFKKAFKKGNENLIKNLKKILIAEDKRLKMFHYSGGTGREIVTFRTKLVDILFCQIFHHSISLFSKKNFINNFVVIAYGGYGRKELNPFSDLDINFFYDSESNKEEVEKIISNILVILWDLGFKLGHSSQTIDEAIMRANSDMITKISMMESRFLAGDKLSFEVFSEKFEKLCIRGQKKHYLQWRSENIKELNKRYGTSVFMQEPHIKSGCGGLRCYQNLLWIGIFYIGTRTTKQLVEKNVIREKEKRALDDAYDFLLKVRTEMHYQMGRTYDILTLHLQGKIATVLGYPEKNIIARCESFMRDYYQHTRNIHLMTSLAVARIKAQENSIKRNKNIQHQKIIDDFIIQEEEIFPKNREIFNKNPHMMMKAFYIMQTNYLKFSAELEDLFKRRLPLVNKVFQYNKENRMLFLLILSRKGEVGKILRLMHDLGFLGKYMPEFEPLTCFVQHEFFHRYTADEHTLLCIDKIDSLLFSNNKHFRQYSDILAECDDPSILYLSMLLHDTGKALHRRNHEEASAMQAQKVARRLQLSSERKKKLIKLVHTHGDLAETARSRNLDDSTTIEYFAKIVGDIYTLNDLMIITLADGLGTNDIGWSDWKEKLVWYLYDKTKQFLLDGLEFKGYQVLQTEVVKKIITMMPVSYVDEIHHHCENMPEKYIRNTDTVKICKHIKLYRQFFKKNKNNKRRLEPIVAWIDYPYAGYSEVIIISQDSKRLLEYIAAAFFVSSMNVLSADIFTRNDHCVLDVFSVSYHQMVPIPHEREKKLFEKKLNEFLMLSSRKSPLKISKHIKLRSNALEDELPISVFINNTIHPQYTFLKVQAPDRVGILYDILRVMTKEGITIANARIATEKRAAIDVFYVLGRGDKKIVDHLFLEKLEKRLQIVARTIYQK